METPYSIPYDFVIQCEQVFSRRSVGYIWGKRGELDPGQMSIVKALYDNRKKGSMEGSVMIEYKLSRSTAGKLGYGRLYGTKGSMETLEREIRGTVCQEFYHDIDIKNCHPVLLYQFAKNVYNIEMPEVRLYCDNRDEYLKRMKDNNGNSMNRDDAKSAILKIMYGGKNEYDFLREFEKEVQKFTRNTLAADEKHKKLLDYVRKQDGDTGLTINDIGKGKKWKIQNTYGTFLALILQSEEAKCMLAMRKSLIEQGWSVDVLAYDGVMVRKQSKKIIAQEILYQTEEDIKNETRYVVELADKEFESFDIPEDTEEEVAPKISKELYMETKKKFETNHFYYSTTNTIAEVNDKGNIIFYTLDHAATLFNTFDFKHGKAIEDRTSFLKLWIKDFTRRQYDQIDQKPSTDPRIYSPPTIFKYQEATTTTNDKVLKYFIELCELASGGSESMKTYMIYWFAHILQKPFENPGTSIILTGRQGCGKDTLGDFMSEWVIGSKYSHNYTSTEQFWDRHDCERMGKFFIKIEEASGFLNRQHIGTMKAIITSHSLTVNPKGTKAITTGNYNRLFMTTNEGSPVKIEEANRRFLISACSPKRVGDFEYWSELRKALFNAEGGATVAKYLMSLNLDGFYPQIIPMSEYAEDVRDNDKSTEDKFIEQWLGEEVNATTFYETYRTYCQDNNLRYAPNSTILGHRILTAIRDGKILKKRKSQGIYYSKP